MMLFTKTRSHFLRSIYWNFRAKDIHNTWGEGTEDFGVLEDVIMDVNPKRILDIGCGSGRCFKLYQQIGIPEVIAQDVSAKALQICRERYPDLEYKLIQSEILDLDYPENHFDLVLSTRVLSAIIPEDIAKTIAHLCRMSRYIYLNETSASDPTLPSSYWFIHDNATLMTKNNFELVKTGMINQQTWHLYKKKTDA